MDEFTYSLLLKARKGATAGFETKQWKEVLTALGFEVTLTKNRNTVTHFDVNRGDFHLAIHKEPQYRRIVFYDLTRGLKAAGFDLVKMASDALGMDVPDVEKHKKAIAAGANDLHRTGTCQCCFNPQKVSKGGGKMMSLHGYQRPGCGYIIGDCMGQGEQPYEVSCELTKKLRTQVENMRKSRQQYLAALNANEIEELGAQIKTNEKERDRFGMMRTKYTVVTVKRGAEASQNPFFPNETWERVPSFESLRESAIDETERAIRQMTSHIDFLTTKITEWKQVWES